MYSERRIQEKIEAIAASTGWQPEYHTQSQIDSFNSHVKSMQRFDAKGREFQSREFDEAEREWLTNEYNLCACNYRYWSEHYAYIKDSQNEIRRYERRHAQEVMLRLWADRELQGLGIEQLYLKGRQQGVSTETELAITHRVNFGFGVNAVVASNDADQAERMSGMMQLAYNEQPFWMQAPPTSDRAGSLMAFGGNATRLSIYTGRNINGIARGDTPTVIHLSEVSSWPNPREIIENSLFKAVHPSPRVFMILESTGNGNTGWWADSWRWAKENFGSGGSRLQPVFFPWFLASDLFPTPTWLREHPLPADWLQQPLTERMRIKCAAYVRSTPLMRELLGESWALPDTQAWFWEFNYLEHAAKRNAKGWLQEMACDDFEALQPKKDLVFDLTPIEDQYARRRQPTVWGITGEQVLEKHHPQDSEVDWEQERFRVSYPGTVSDITGSHSKDLVWEFVPLLVPRDAEGQPNLLDRAFDPNGKLLVFEWPEEGYDYSIGNDTASGGSGDNTTICVNRRSRTGRDPDVQVAEFASNLVSSAEAHAFMLAVAALYSQELTAYAEPLVATEQVRGPGDNVQLQMKMHGYKRFYKFSRLDGKRPKADKRKSKKEGWYSFTWSRNFMLDIFKHAVENGWYELNSPFLLRGDIPSFQIDQTAGGKVRYDHASGKHDDRIFAAAIAYIIANDTESMSKRVERKFKPDDEQEVEVDRSYPLTNAVTWEQVGEGFDATT